VEEADFAAEAALASSRVFKNDTGGIVTDYKFFVNQGFGFDEKEFTLEIPGGTLDGVTTAVEGAPYFKQKINIFLLLKKVESKIYLSNFTMGVYGIIEKNGITYYQSEIFSQVPNIGEIRKDEMIKLMQSKWKIERDKSNSQKTMLINTKYIEANKELKSDHDIAKGKLEKDYKELIIIGLGIIILIIFVIRKI
jgi:hypothetical protein